MTQKYYLFDFFIVLFCFLTMFVPDSYQIVRLGLLFVLLVLTCFDKAALNLQFDIIGTFILLGLLAYNIFCCALGAVRNAPGAYRCLTAEVFWPIFFSFIGIKLSYKFSIKQICKILVRFETFIVLWDLWYCLGELKLVPFSEILKLVDLQYMFGEYGFFIQFSTTHMVTHIFMIPFTLAYISFVKEKSRYILLICMQIFLVCISGRAALILITFAFLGLVLFKFLRIKGSISLKLLKVSLVFGIFFGIFYLVSTGVANGVIEYVSNKIINSSRDTGHIDSTRYYQHKYLLEGWQNHIFFGNGTGSYDPRVIRDEEHPWFYELAYHTFLYQKGLFWVITFGVQLIYIFLGLKKLSKKNPESKCFVFGLVAILIANSVDPYLNKFGCLWMLYLPFVFVLCKSKPFSLRTSIVKSLKEKDF